MIRRLCLAHALTLALALGTPAASAPAQTPLTLLELKISLWPEYDRPAMLVIYRGQVAQSAAGPAALQIQIPAAAASTLSVAYGDGGQLLNVNHTDSVDGAVMSVAFTTPNGSFQVEYYDSSLDVSTPDRHFAFSAASPYAIENLIVEVQQPAGASAFTGTPQLGSRLAGPDGLTYYSIIRSNVPAQDPIRLELAYTKTTSALTVSSAGAAGGGSSTGVTPAAQTPAWVYGLLGLGAILLVVGGLIWYARHRMRNNRAGRPGRGKTGQWPRPAADRAEGQPAIYCHECGHKSRPGDRFCGNCGTELRRSP